MLLVCSPVLPSEGPRISAGGRTSHKAGDVVTVNCTSAKSKPAATLNFTINDEPVSLKSWENEKLQQKVCRHEASQDFSTSRRFEKVNEFFVAICFVSFACLPCWRFGLFRHHYCSPSYILLQTCMSRGSAKSCHFVHLNTQTFNFIYISVTFLSLLTSPPLSSLLIIRLAPSMKLNTRLLCMQMVSSPHQCC